MVIRLILLVVVRSDQNLMLDKTLLCIILNFSVKELVECCVDAVLLLSVPFVMISGMQELRNLPIVANLL